MDLVIGIIFDVITTAALVYLFIFGYNSEYEAATIIAPVLIYIIWSRRAQMIKTRKWRESIEKQMKNKDEKSHNQTKSGGKPLKACRRFLLTYFANASLWVSANQILQNSSLFPHT